MRGPSLEPSPPSRPGGPAVAGVVYGLAAYLAWGVAPVYFKAVAAVPALEVLAHRIVWSALLLAAWVALKGRLATTLGALRSRRTLATLAVTTLLIALNWLTFIWAIANDRLLHASLGYYINPLLNVALGYLFLGERHSRLHLLSFALAGLGVAYLAVSLGTLPWVALVLAVSFGVYGLLRKTVAVDALSGLSVETALLTPVALAGLLWLAARGQGAFASSARMSLLLAAAGLVTSLPLLWFTNAARRLRYTTVGILQYLAPTGQFLLAVAVYGEPFGRAQLVSFACIWTALFLFSLASLRESRRTAPTGPASLRVLSGSPCDASAPPRRRAPARRRSAARAGCRSSHTAGTRTGHPPRSREPSRRRCRQSG